MGEWGSLCIQPTLMKLTRAINPKALSSLKLPGDTGRARRCGWFDAPIARYAVRVNGLTDFFLTKVASN